MSKILLTGVTRVQANDASRVRLSYASNPICLHEALVRTGHEVVWRPVVPGEDLSGFDLLIIGVAPVISSWGSKHCFGALWALAQPNAKLLLVDDWHVKNIASDLKGVPNRADRLLHPKMPRAHRPEGEAMVGLLLKVCDYLGSQTWRQPTLGSFFDWGDRAKFKEDTKIGELLHFDPTCFQPNYGIVATREKSREWVLASLGDHTRWMKTMDLGWPARTIGRKKWGDGKEHDDERMQESELMRVYETSWGVLSPRYHHAGSGWWRARFEYARQAGCVLLAHVDEIYHLGPSYTMPAKCPRTVEDMSDDDLAALSANQSMAFLGRAWSEDRFVSWASDLVDAMVLLGPDTMFSPDELKAAAGLASSAAPAVEDIFE